MASRRLVGGYSCWTYLLDLDDGDRLVVRMPPQDAATTGAHDVEREFLVLSFLAEHRFPAPTPIAFCRDTDVLGTEFYAMRYVEGDVFDTRAVARAAGLNEERIEQYRARLMEVLATLHQLPTDAFPEELRRPGNFVERQVARWNRRWRQLTDAFPDSADRIHDAIELGERFETLTATGPERMVHGDFRLGNAIVHDGSIRAVLDWELAALGEPYLDLAYHAWWWIADTAAAPTAVDGADCLGQALDAVKLYDAVDGPVDPERLCKWMSFVGWRTGALRLGVAERRAPSDERSELIRKAHGALEMALALDQSC